MEPIHHITIKTALDNLRHFRIQSGLSQKEVANKLCVSPRTFRDMENGMRTITLDQFFHLAAIYEVTVASLVLAQEEIIEVKLRRVS